MKRPAPRWLLVGLGAWALGPLGLLLVRGLSRSWLFPVLWPEFDPWALTTLAPGRSALSRSLGTSVGLACATGVSSAVVAFASVYVISRAGRSVRSLVTMGAFFIVVAPPVALSIGLQVGLLAVGLRGTLAGVMLAHLVPATGYVMLLALGVVGGLDWTFEDEARTLGASPWQALARVTIPALRRPLVEGMVLGGLVSWGQVATTLLVGGGAVRTLPVDLLAFVQAGNDQLASVAALVLSLPPVCAIGLLQAGAVRTRTAP